MDFAWMLLAWLLLFGFGCLSLLIIFIAERPRRGHVSQCELRTLWFAYAAEQLDWFAA